MEAWTAGDIRPSISMGVFRSSGKGSEDKCSVFASHENQDAPGVASFGVFDGHSGEYAAELCSHELHKEVVSCVFALSEAVARNRESQHFTLQHIASEDLHDALLCESLRRSCLALDEYVRSSNQSSGTTAVSLFLQQVDRYTVRAVCANIGDSRCVLYGQPLNSMKFLTDPVPSSSQPSATLPRVFPMTEDHKLSTLRERSRVLGKLSLQNERSWMSRPTSTFVPLPASIVTYQNWCSACVPPTFEIGYPSKDRIAAAEVIIAALAKEGPWPSSYIPSDASLRIESEDCDTELSSSSPDSIPPAELEVLQATRSRTFIEGEDELVGSMGGRVRTTRSIGGKYGPKGLTSTPDFSAVNIGGSESVRFILAARALWDNLDEAFITEAVRSHASPRGLAKYLGQSLEARLGSSWTVIVVDVHPQHIGRDLGLFEGDCAACTLA